MSDWIHMPSVATSRREMADARVEDAMHLGVVTCAADAPLTDVAALMAGHRIHAVVVDRSEPRDAEPLVVSALDMANGVLGGFEALEAGDVAGSPTVSVGREAPLVEAVQLMRDYQTAHLLVVDDQGGPIGVLSTLDVARLIAAAHPGAADGDGEEGPR